MNWEQTLRKCTASWSSLCATSPWPLYTVQSQRGGGGWGKDQAWEGVPAPGHFQTPGGFRARPVQWVATGMAGGSARLEGIMTCNLRMAGGGLS